MMYDAVIGIVSFLDHVMRIAKAACWSLTNGHTLLDTFLECTPRCRIAERGHECMDSLMRILTSL